MNDSFKEFYETDIFSALKEISRDVNFITKVLEKGENGFIVEDYDKSMISIFELNGIVNSLSQNGLNFNI